jgi:hypothetical protein
MKQKLTVLIAAALLTLSANSSFAATSFSDNTLYRVIYDGTGIRELADLGSVNSLLSGGTSTISPGTFTAIDPAALSVSYFALDRHTVALWVSSIAAPTSTTGGFDVLNGGVDSTIHQLLATAVKGSTGTSLASLSNGSASSVSQTLYYINDANTDGVSGIGRATITTSATTATPLISPVPLPPAFLLLGSGLFGLAGVRRRCADTEVI